MAEKGMVKGGITGMVNQGWLKRKRKGGIIKIGSQEKRD
jgi:hypothetical protein